MRLMQFTLRLPAICKTSCWIKQVSIFFTRIPANAENCPTLPCLSQSFLRTSISAITIWDACAVWPSIRDHMRSDLDGQSIVAILSADLLNMRLAAR